MVKCYIELEKDYDKVFFFYIYILSIEFHLMSFKFNQIDKK